MRGINWALPLVISFIFVCNDLYAQTYEDSDFQQIGDEWIVRVDTIPGWNLGVVAFQPPPWNFNPFLFETFTDTIRFVSPEVVASGALFPSADFAITNLSRSNNDELDVDMIYANGGQYFSLGGEMIVGQSEPPARVPFVNDSPVRMMTLPMTVGLSYRDTVRAVVHANSASVGMPPGDSLRMVSTSFRFDTVDATGTLHIPGLILDNCMRRMRSDSIIDSLFIFNQGMWDFVPEGMQEPNQRKTLIEWYHESYPWWVLRLNVRINNQSGENELGFYGSEARYIPAPPLSIGLDMSSNVTDVVTGTMNTLTVSALNMSDNLVNPNFNDTVRLTILPNGFESGSTFWYLPVSSVRAIDGVATFQDLTFIEPGVYSIYASSDTAYTDTLSITVHPNAERIVLSHQNLSANTFSALPTISASAASADGNIDVLFYQGNVHMGRLSGPGEMIGTKQSTLINGTATFNDIEFTHPGTYELLFYTPYGQQYLIADTLTVNVTHLDGTWEYSYTDTLSEYVDRAQEFVWHGNADGFLSGTSRGGYTEVAQQFDFTGQGRLTEVMIHFASRMEVGTHDDVFQVRIYDAGVVDNSAYINSTEEISFMDSLPIGLLGVQNFPAESMVFGDYWIQNPTAIHFDSPPLIRGNFIVSVVANIPTANDTIILWHSVPGDGQQEYRSLKRMTMFSEEGDTVWLRDKYWRPQFDVDLMIAPVIERDELSVVTGISMPASEGAWLYPTLSKGQVHWDVPASVTSIEVRALDGRLVLGPMPNNATSGTLSMGDQVANGLYVLLFRQADGTPAKAERFVLSR
jgi:hypothetical protein